MRQSPYSVYTRENTRKKQYSDKIYEVIIYFKQRVHDPIHADHCTKNEVFHSGFLSKRDQIRSLLRIWPHLLKKFLMGNSIFCAVDLDKSSKLF